MMTLAPGKSEPLTVSERDASPVKAIIFEMKLRCGATTDAELAEFLGRRQPTVSTWRKRGVVPEKALLQFEHRMRAKAA